MLEYTFNITQPCLTNNSSMILHSYDIEEPFAVAPLVCNDALSPFHKKRNKSEADREDASSVSKQANSNAHLSHYSTSASESGMPVRAGSVHLALFDNMFNDRLTADLQMRAGIGFAKFGSPCRLCDASVLMCIIWFCDGVISRFEKGNSAARWT